MSDGVLAYGPLLLVVIGWAVVNSQHNKRESRKEARALVDAAKETINDASKKTVDDLAEGANESAYDVKAGLEALEIEFERLPNFVKGCPLMQRLIEFADALTGGDFESANRPKRGPTSREVATVLLTRNRLLAELERQFKAYYL